MGEAFGNEAGMSRETAILPWVAGGWGSLGVAGAGLAAGGMPLWGLGCSLVGMLGAAFGVARSGKRISNPYAALTARFEALADGDADSAVPCVDRSGLPGRLAQVASTLRTRAGLLRDGAHQQELLALALDEGLAGLADGNLSYRMDDELPGDYEQMRHHFNEAMESLSGTLGAVAHATRGLHSGASEIRAATQDLSLRTEQQAASLQETANSMNEITDMVKQSAQSAGRAAQAIGDAHHEASEGGLVVERAVRAMSAIEHSAQEISQIINVIDGIAFQTNLLALNAGVEAARAGDAGKGFAVVANEVRALAQRSADAAKDINALITTSAQQVEQGVSLVAETGAMLNRIVTRVGEISTLVSAISESAETQSVGLQQANVAVGEMDKMTQQNAAMVEESTAAVRSLASQADELARLVARFRLDTGVGPSLPVGMPSQPRAVESRQPVALASAPQPVPMAASRAAPAYAVAVDEDDWSEF